MKVTLQKSGQVFNLEQTDYVAGGGEGKIYRKGSTAFKIYHDVAKMIPLGKIQELCSLSPKNVLAPRDICISRNKAIGFSMDFISDRIYLCWMYNKLWKQKNNVDLKVLIELINIMRETTIILHDEGCVVGDYNELQFLCNKKLDNVFFCDADSYQTKSYPCTAIMDTVRDRTVNFGYFDEKTDWFGFAVVTIQLFCGIHPYQGNHLNYTRRQIKEMILMDKNISIFNKEVTLPKQSEPLNSIPHTIRGWYEEVLENKGRNLPPVITDSTSLVILPKHIVQATATFTVKELFQLPELILEAICMNGSIYCITRKGIYRDGKFVMVTSNAEYSIVSCAGSNNPLFVEQYGSRVTIYNGSSPVANLSSYHFFVHHGFIFAVVNGQLHAMEINMMGATVLVNPRLVANIFENSYAIYQGMIVQDVMGIPWIIVPVGFVCHNIQINELSGHRVLNAKYDEGGSLRMCVIISEHKSKYYRSTIIFTRGDPSAGYQFSSCNTSASDNPNFTVLNKNVGAAIIEDIRLDLITMNGTKEVADPPIDISMPLFSDGVRVLVVNGNKVLHISTK